MKKAIIYYSATGNTLYCAKQFKDFSLFDAISLLEHRIELPEDIEILGLFSPIYYSAIAKPMRDAIRQILSKRDNSKLCYIFSTLTKGAKSRTAERIMEKELEDIGLNLSFSASVLMPDCYLPLCKNSPTKEETEKLKNSIDETINSLVQRVEKEEFELPPFSLTYRLIKKMSESSISNGEENKHLSVSSSCTGCSLCYSICPNNNIRIENNRVIHGKKCISCYACYNFCPVHAIKYDGKEKGFYVPLVAVEELKKR